MDYQKTNQDRTAEYLKNFNREKVLKYLIKNDSPVIFDVGANVGTTLKEFKSWWPTSHIHCFEPQEECWEHIEKFANKFPSDIKINRFAVGNKSIENATFYTHDINNEISGFNKVNLESLDSVYLNQLLEITPQSLDDYKEMLNHQRTVKVIRLDEYMSTHSLNNIDMLKIDTQGFEPEVLEGLGNKLSNVDIVLTELMFFDYYERKLTFSDIERFLVPAGFELYDISYVSKNPLNGRTDWADIMYVNKRIRSRADASK